MHILICKTDLSVVFLSKYLRGCFNVQINTALAAAQYLQRLQRKNENGTFLLSLCFRSKELKKDVYLAPYTCAEIGFLYQDEGDLDRAKEYLERARYWIWILYRFQIVAFIFKRFSFWTNGEKVKAIERWLGDVRLLLVACIGLRICNCFLVFPRLPSVPCSTALMIGLLFSRAYQLSVTCFPAFTTLCMLVFSRLPLCQCFPVLGMSLFLLQVLIGSFHFFGCCECSDARIFALFHGSSKKAASIVLSC